MTIFAANIVRKRNNAGDKRWNMNRLERMLFRQCGNAFRVKLLRRLGMTMGEGCVIASSVIFGSEPFLIRLGNRVCIAPEVMFITHQGATWVFRSEKKVTSFGNIQIGDNSFLGARSIILPNVKIGENCIIAAGAVVARSCADNGVYFGNPSRRVSSIEAFIEQRCEKNIDLPSEIDMRKKKLIDLFWGNLHE